MVVIKKCGELCSVSRENTDIYLVLRFSGCIGGGAGRSKL